MRTAETRHAQIERRIVDEDERVGLFVQQRLLRNTEIPADLAEVCQHGSKAHKRHPAYMLVQAAPGGGHLVAAES